MATWDNSDLGLAGWCKVVGDSRDVPWQLGTTGTWDWQGGGRFSGCPMANWNNWNIPCSPNCLRCHNMSTLTCYGSPGCLCSILP